MANNERINQIHNLANTNSMYARNKEKFDLVIENNDSDFDNQNIDR